MPNDEIFSPEDPYAPRRSKRGCGIFALVAGIVVGGGVLAVACCGGVVYFATGVVAEQVKADLRGNPVIEEHIGPVRSIRIDWVATAAAPGEDEFVYEVEGPKGKGRIQAVTQTTGPNTEHVVSGTLEMADGERYDLFPAEAGESR